MIGVLQDWLSNWESGSTTIRNVVLVIAALLALWFAKQRIKVADRQAETAQHGLLNERYQKGAEMLGSKALSVRLGAIHALDRLRTEYPRDYHVLVMKLFVALVVDRTRNVVSTSYVAKDENDTGREDEGGRDAPELAEDLEGPWVVYFAAKSKLPPAPELASDVKEVMRLIAGRNEEQVALEVGEKLRLDLSHAFLAGLTLSRINWRADFSDINFTKTNLSRARCWQARFSMASLAGANLAGASLPGADFRDADMRRVDLTAANLIGADLRNADLGMVDWAAENLWGGRLFPTKLIGAILSGVDLRGANLGGADLRGANLGCAKLDKANLVNADLSEANMGVASLAGADLSGAVLKNANLGGGGADLSEARLLGADFDGAILDRANLSAADFSEGSSIRTNTRLTQDQLDQSQADPARPPNIEGVRDAVSGEPLVWRGKPLDDDWYDFR